MTLDDFAALIGTRIPNPAEFLAFAESQRWEVGVRADGTGYLRADPKDPLAVSLARMFGREPWRSDVLKLVGGRSHAEQVTAVRQAVGDQPAGSDGEACSHCGNFVYPGAGVTAEDVYSCCLPPHRDGCPYRRQPRG